MTNVFSGWPWNVQVATPPPTLLYEFVIQQDWDSVVKRAQSHPGDIQFKDSYNQFTALHVACQHDEVPVEVIHALVDAYNQYFDEKELYKHLTTPMHILLTSNRNPRRRVDCSIVKAILRIPNITHATHLDQAPIHLACLMAATVDIVQILIEADPASLLYRDAHGNTPLLCAISSSLRTQRQTPTCDMLKLLLQTCPETARKYDYRGVSPLQHLFTTCLPPNISMSMEDSIIRSSLQLPEFQLFWNKVRLLLCALHRGNIADLDTPNFKCLHAVVAANPNHAPMELIHFASILHADEAMQTDEHGHVPLAIAAASPFLSSGVNRRHVLECLLRADAKAASVADPNKRLPFLLAITNTNPTTWESGIQCLLDAAPHAIAIRDRSTRMYPFMIAALQNQDELVGLSNTFRLLREAPHLICM